MNLLLQNPGDSVQSIMSGSGFTYAEPLKDDESGMAGEGQGPEDEFSTFTL